MTLRDIEVSHEAVRDRKGKLLPVMGDTLRQDRLVQDLAPLSHRLRYVRHAHFR